MLEVQDVTTRETGTGAGGFGSLPYRSYLIWQHNGFQVLRLLGLVAFQIPQFHLGLQRY